MDIKTWKSHPLYLGVVEILETNGQLADVKLYDLLKESYEDISFGKLNKTLMKLEIQGKIRVSTPKKGQRRVELIPEKETELMQLDG